MQNPENPTFLTNSPDSGDFVFWKMEKMYETLPLRASEAEETKISIFAKVKSPGWPCLGPKSGKSMVSYVLWALGWAYVIIHRKGGNPWNFRIFASETLRKWDSVSQFSSKMKSGLDKTRISNFRPSGCPGGPCLGQNPSKSIISHRPGPWAGPL